MTNRELTELANRNDVSKEEFDILTQNYKKLKSYIIETPFYTLRLVATDDLNLLEYIKNKYNGTKEIRSINEIITTFREVDYNF